MVALAPLWPLPPDASAQGPATDALLSLNLWVALALLALLHLLAAVALLRAREPATRSRTWSRAAFEYAPVAVLAVLFGFLTLRSERLWAATRYTGANLAALQVEATGMQFAWYFRYPGPDAAFGRTAPALVAPGEGNPLGLDPADAHGSDDLVASELVLPAGREIDIHLRAQDVIHGFSIPALRIKQNAVPGTPLDVHFTPTVPGTYAILCTQVCGLGHFRMSATLRVVSPAEYAAWLQAREAAR